MDNLTHSPKGSTALKMPHQPSLEEGHLGDGIAHRECPDRKTTPEGLVGYRRWDSDHEECGSLDADAKGRAVAFSSSLRAGGATVWNI